MLTPLPLGHSVDYYAHARAGSPALAGNHPLLLLLNRVPLRSLLICFGERPPRERILSRRLGADRAGIRGNDPRASGAANHKQGKKRVTHAPTVRPSHSVRKLNGETVCR